MRTAALTLSLAILLTIGTFPVRAQSIGTVPSPQATSTATTSAVSPTSTEQLSDEEKFALAKEGLRKALTLALEKVTSLQEDLEKRTFDEGSIEAALQAHYLSQLEEYRTFYNDRLASIDTLQSLEEAQALAAEIKKYRDTVYTPGVEKIIQFALVFYTEDVINIANERLASISNDIKELTRIGLLKEGSFQDTLTATASLLDEASRLKSEARRLIIAQEDNASPKQLLETSLGNVKTAYTTFLDISRAIREALGLKE